MEIKCLDVNEFNTDFCRLGRNSAQIKSLRRKSNMKEADCQLKFLDKA